jgi:hypothetical protein
MNYLMLARLARKSQALSRYDFLRLSLSRRVRRIETQQYFVRREQVGLLSNYETP